MTVSDRRSALAALAAARPGLAELDPARHPEDVAADIIDIWSSVETALRSLVGGSVLTGQPLIRELRERELISLAQAHSLLELLAVRERVDRSDYLPTEADIGVVREAYTELETSLLDSAAEPAGTSRSSSTVPSGAVAPGAEVPGAVASAAEPQTVYVPPACEGGARRGRIVLVALVVLATVLLAAWGVYYYLSNRAAVPGDLAAAMAAYTNGQPEAARAAFLDAARAHPALALPHLYLGRIARDEGDFVTAGSELKTAVELEPRNVLALRELGAFFLARGTRFASEGRSDLATADYNAARRSYTEVITLAPTDSVALGYLGCALERLGRATEAANWFARAGEGPWSGCASASVAPESPRP